MYLYMKKVRKKGREGSFVSLAYTDTPPPSSSNRCSGADTAQVGVEGGQSGLQGALIVNKQQADNATTAGQSRQL